VEKDKGYVTTVTSQDILPETVLLPKEKAKEKEYGLKEVESPKEEERDYVTIVISPDTLPEIGTLPKRREKEESIC